MKITLYMAISIDGYIAKLDGDSDRVSEVDVPLFEAEIEKRGCIVVGRKTFDQYLGDIYPVEGVENIVISSNQNKEYEMNGVSCVRGISQALEAAKEKGFNEALLIGGGLTNGGFLKEGLINEIILSVHPVILGDGIRLFEQFSEETGIEYVSQRELGQGLIQLRYKVKG